MTSKERSELRARANGLEAVLSIGKGGVGESVIKSAAESLTAHELIKVKVLETAPETAAACAGTIAAALDAEIVQVIGRRFTLYKYNPELHKPTPVAAKKRR